MEKKTNKPKTVKRKRTGAKIQRKNIYISVAIASLVLVCVMIALWQGLYGNRKNPDEVFAAFIQQLKAENINSAAEECTTDPSIIQLSEGSFEYRLFEVIKNDISYSFVSQSYTSDKETAVISVNVSAFDLSALCTDVERQLETNKEYALIKDEAEQKAYKRELIIKSAGEHLSEYIIINTVKVGFSNDNEQWKIIPDATLMRSLVGLSEN